MSYAAVPADALKAIWERHRDVVLARLEAIEHGVVPDVGPDPRVQAASAAHQLAGTVGTFGFTRATELARELEVRLREPGPVSADLRVLAVELRIELIGDVGASADKSKARGPCRGRVMTVDDDPMILDTVRLVLAGRGLDVVTEADSRQVLDRLPGVDPDLLILDVDMPHVDGITLCARIRLDARNRGLPIVFLTTHTDAEIVGAAYHAGADGHLSKPVIGDELISCVEHQLSARGGGRL